MVKARTPTASYIIARGSTPGYPVSSTTPIRHSNGVLHHKLVRRLCAKNLAEGDHIYVRRGLHSHHGIYVGQGRVIHFKGEFKEKSNPVVRETGLEEFLRGGTLRREDHKHRLPPEETVRRARRLLEGKDYSLLRSNCEHMATFCATGKAKSRQVRRAAAGLSATIAGVIVSRRLRRKSST